MVDYSKWKDFADSDDDSDSEQEERTAAAEAGHRMLTGWLTEAAPAVSKEEIEHLAQFVELQQPELGERDNRSRAKQIVKFLDKRREPRTAPLVAAVAAAQTRNLDVLDPSTKPTAVRVNASLITALNTLCAAKENGGPRKLFELLREYPGGDASKNYARQAYAAAAVDAFNDAMRSRAAAQAPEAPSPRETLPALRAPGATAKADRVRRAEGAGEEVRRRPAAPQQKPPQKQVDGAAQPAEAPKPPPRKPWRKWELVVILVALFSFLLILLGILVTSVMRLRALMDAVQERREAGLGVVDAGAAAAAGGMGAVLDEMGQS